MSCKKYCFAVFKIKVVVKVQIFIECLSGWYLLNDLRFCIQTYGDAYFRLNIWSSMWFLCLFCFRFSVWFVSFTFFTWWKSVPGRICTKSSWKQWVSEILYKFKYLSLFQSQLIELAPIEILCMYHNAVRICWWWHNT